MLANKIHSAFDRDKNLKVLFFFDPQGEEKDTVLNLSLENIRVEVFNGRWLDYKMKFGREWKDEKLFFYFEQPSPKTQDEMLDFQLLDLLCANRELALDSVEDFMTEYRLLPHQMSLVNKYKSELTHLKVIPVIKPILNTAQFEEKAIQQGLMSALLNFSKIENWNTLIIRLLTYSAPSKQKNLTTLFNKLQKLPLSDEINRHIRDVFGIGLSGNDETEVADLVKRLKYNLITQAFPAQDADPYKDLKIRDIDCLQAMNLLYETAIHDKLLNKAFDEAFELHGKTIQADKMVSLYGCYADYVYQTDDLIWEILRRMTENDFTPSVELKERLRSFQGKSEEGVLKNCISFLNDSIQMLIEIDQAKTLIFNIPEEYIKTYTESFYQIDTSYRKAILAYQELNLQSTPIDEALKTLKKRVDKTYFDFIFRLNHEWLRCMKEVEFDYKQIRYDKQYDFYENKIAPLQQKTAVIISDALRYESAVELLGELHKDEKNVSSLSLQLASIPSTTKFGMAHLLPAQSRTYVEGEVLLDDNKCALIEQREKILKQRKEDSRAILFEKISDNDKQQNRELFKSGVVYVYHDIIDKTGHKGTERDAFRAVETAIIELSKLVKQIIAGFNVAKVFITSDHGFLYNDFDIAEADKNEIEDTEIVESDARHYTTKDHEDVSIGYKIPLFKVSRHQEPYYVVIPDSVNRFKKAGSRYRYTHGGGSLQELILPVIECMRKDERVQRKVELLLATPDKDLKVISNTLRLSVAQKSAVSAAEKERTVEAGLYENDRLVSGIATLRLNATDPKPTNRMQHTSLVLNNKTTSTILKLKIYDVEDKLNPLLEKNITNNTLMARDF
jgi:uncharacterized protein (TIGR02687 family)